MRDSKVIALDLSTSTGWAFFSEGGLVECGRVVTSGPTALDDVYPKSYVVAANLMADQVCLIVNRYPDAIVVIEETNKSRSRYAQKVLEFIHKTILDRIIDTRIVVYINTSDWRKITGAQLSDEDKKHNRALSRGLKAGKTKKELGIKGKTTKKHVAIRTANNLFDLKLIIKDDDIADAVCLGASYLLGVGLCDGR